MTFTEILVVITGLILLLGFIAILVIVINLENTNYISSKDESINENNTDNITVILDNTTTDNNNTFNHRAKIIPYDKIKNIYEDNTPELPKEGYN